MAVPLSVDTPPKPIAVRNVKNVVLGDTLFKTWYPSFYPKELVGREVDRLYVCQWCFKYSKEPMPFLAHVVCLYPAPDWLLPILTHTKKLCQVREEPSPGRLIYSKDQCSIYEVDGEEHKASILSSSLIQVAILMYL